MQIKLNSYRADAEAFENVLETDETYLEFDMAEVDYITSDGFAAIIKLKQRGKDVKLVNVNEHIKDTIELINLEGVI